MTTIQYPGSPEPMSDEERERWIANDEGLHEAQLASGLEMSDYIIANRAQIDLYIDSIRTGLRQSHFGKYGG